MKICTLPFLLLLLLSCNFQIDAQQRVPPSVLSLFLTGTSLPLPELVSPQPDSSGAFSLLVPVDETQTASALVCKPESRAGHHPLVVFLHWGGGSKEYFLNEALAFAKDGFLAVSLDAPWLWTTYDTLPGPLRSYPTGIINSVKATHQIIDWAASQKEFNGQVYYIGHSYGATLGGLLLAVEPRIKGAVLMAGLPSISASIEEDPLGQWGKAKTEQKPVLDSMLRRLRIMEPEDFINYSKANVFHQVAKKDQYVTKAQSERYIKATRDKKKVAYYDTDHVFLHPGATVERREWISKLEKNK